MQIVAWEINPGDMDIAIAVNYSSWISALIEQYSIFRSLETAVFYWFIEYEYEAV